MDTDLLNSCSLEVQKSLRYLDEILDSSNSQISGSPYYILDFVNSNEVDLFMDDWSDKNYDPGVMVYEYIDQLVFLLKLEKEYHPNTWGTNEQLRQFATILKAEQTVDGAFRISDHEHVGGLWFMVHYAPNSEVTENAVDYYITDTLSRNSTSYFYWNEIAIGSIALCELDPYYYEDTLYEIKDQIAENLPDRLEEYRNSLANNEKSSLFEYILPYILVALAKLPESPQDLMDEITELLRERLQTWEFEEKYPETIANMTLGLIANGEGPKVSSYHAQLDRQRERQRFKNSQPEFISTYPTADLRTRRKEIYEKVESLIHSVEDELRISTLRIDMFYDDIIDLIRETSVDVKILTRQEAPSGERKRIKQAVINELILETEDEVRGDDIVHSRMVIGDDSQLVISTADLTRTQLHDEFNSGIYTRDGNAIKEAIRFFDDVWDEADPLDTDPWNR